MVPTESRAPINLKVDIQEQNHETHIKKLPEEDSKKGIWIKGQMCFEDYVFLIPFWLHCTAGGVLVH